MLREIEGLGQEDHFSLYGLEDHWWKEDRRRGPNKPRSPKGILVTWSFVSATQIENFVKCKRSWYFKSILKVPENFKGHQELGKTVHLIAEKIPKGLSAPVRADTQATQEEWDKAQQLAAQLLPLIPTDDECPRAKREWGIRMPTYPGGPTFTGYTDIAIPPGYGWPAFLIPENEAIIGDYKTLSDFRYMKTPEELASSIQMMSYAKWALEEWPSGLVGEFDPIPETVRLLHIYAKTRPPYSRSSIRNESAIVTVPQINAFWDKTLDIVREMQQTSACTSSEDVEANGVFTEHCSAYGGCSFREKCGISKESNIKTLFQISKKPITPSEPPEMSGSLILQRIAAARANANGQTPTNTETNPNPTPEPSPSQPTPVPEAAPTPTPKRPVGPISKLIKTIEDQGKGKPQLGGTVAKAYGNEIGSVADGFAGTGVMGLTCVNTLSELVNMVQTLIEGVVPPDAPDRRQEIITRPGDPVVDPNKVVNSTEEDDDEESQETGTNGSAGHSTSTPSGPDVNVAHTPSNPTEVTKRRGRPSREEMAAREAAEKAKFEALVQAEVEKRLGAVGGPVVSPENVVNLANQLWETEKAAFTKELELTRAKAEAERNQANEWLTQLEDQKKENQALRSKADGKAEDTGCTLYIDCYPTKGQRDGLVDFFEWIQPIAQAVAEGNKVQDYRLIQYNSKGLLASHIRELVKAEGLPKALVIPQFAAGADVALEILSPLAKKVIRKLG